jgi:hypothetical protein
VGPSVVPSSIILLFFASLLYVSIAITTFS